MKREHLYKTGLIMAVVALAWLIVNFIILDKIRMMMDLKISAEEIKSPAVVIYLGLLYFLLFHLFSILSLVLQIKYIKADHFFRYAFLIYGSISTILILGDAALLSDIGKEYLLWDVSSEFTALYVVQGLHGFFILGMVINHIFAIRIVKNTARSVVGQRDDAVFISANTVGLICGLVGMVVVSMEFLQNRSVEFIRSVILWDILFILMPYGLLVIVWFAVKLSERPLAFYDEKQFSDISRASFNTLLSAVFFMGAGYLLGLSSPVEYFFLLWIPLVFHVESF